MNSFTAYKPETLADFNTGPHALSDLPCNSEFLEHEKWLLCMLSEIELSPPYVDAQSLETRRLELLQLVQNELQRLQTHKEVEWRRQRATAYACSQAGVPFLDSNMAEWLARLLSRPGMEEVMDAQTERARGSHKPVMLDIWDAPIFRELKKSGQPFVVCPPGEGRYVFGLSVDSFNPFQSKEAKQNVSVTGIYMVCLNLPPHLRYLPENVYLVGIIP
ncbi:hypothetical protein BC628DRAFT_1327003, partial [Trametes gibbosa]